VAFKDNDVVAEIKFAQLRLVGAGAGADGKVASAAVVVILGDRPQIDDSAGAILRKRSQRQPGQRDDAQNAPHDPSAKTSFSLRPAGWRVKAAAITLWGLAQGRRGKAAADKQTDDKMVFKTGDFLGKAAEKTDQLFSFCDLEG